MRFAIAQYNPIVGDLRGNLDRLLAAAANAAQAGADLFVAPELALVGYPPRDLVDRPGFVQDALHMVNRLIYEAPMPMLVGAIVAATGDPRSSAGRVANGAILAHAGQVLACHRKQLLPSYDVFDEGRYFTPGNAPTVVHLNNVALGISVCEDVWNDKEYWQPRRYESDPIAEEVAQGAEVLVNISASPYDRHKPEERLAMLKALVRRHRRPLLYVNQVGGNDSLLFDGRSLALNADGELTWRAAAFKEVLAVTRWVDRSIAGDLTAEPSCWQEEATEALCLGLRDYLRKCGFTDVVLGLSGGIDSALTAALAVRALGPRHVRGVAMPSRYSSQGSLKDAQELADNLQIRCDVVPIEPVVEAFRAALAESFAGLAEDATEENLQARIRGTLLMAYANKFGSMLLSTGNKSEIAVGYCTLYGDMSGGLAPLSDLYKTEVYALARYFNASHGVAIIPDSSINKAPSAELRAGQTDQDSLPPYELLDAILKGYVDDVASPATLIARGHPAEIVHRIAALVERSEHKRRQMAPGLRVSRKAFGEGRRIPVAQRYR